MVGRACESHQSSSLLFGGTRKLGPPYDSARPPPQRVRPAEQRQGPRFRNGRSRAGRSRKSLAVGHRRLDRLIEQRHRVVADGQARPFGQGGGLRHVQRAVFDDRAAAIAIGAAQNQAARSVFSKAIAPAPFSIAPAKSPLPTLSVLRPAPLWFTVPTPVSLPTFAFCEMRSRAPP